MHTTVCKVLSKRHKTTCISAYTFISSTYPSDFQQNVEGVKLASSNYPDLLLKCQNVAVQLKFFDIFLSNDMIIV